MDILDTIEVRWFIDDVAGPAAAAARSWFAGVPVEGLREDRYLLTGRDDVGFKARGRVIGGAPAVVETKYLLESLGPMRLHARVSGVVERWRKLSLEIADRATLQKGGEWIPVFKSRRARRLGYEDAACGVEVTEIEYDDGGRRGHALTIALEAVGPTNGLLEVLLRAGREAFDSAPGLELEASTSMSYPRWLRLISTERLGCALRVE